MGFDLKVNNLTQQSEAGYEFELSYPGSFEPTGAFVKVRGSNSSKVKAYGRKKYNEYIAKVQAAKRRGKEPEEITPEEADELQVESAIIRLIDWRGIDEDGKPVVFSQENAQRILSEHPWIATQIIEESDNLANFTNK